MFNLLLILQEMGGKFSLLHPPVDALGETHALSVFCQSSIGSSRE